jgi:hypothetical protein
MYLILILPLVTDANDLPFFDYLIRSDYLVVTAGEICNDVKGCFNVIE